MEWILHLLRNTPELAVFLTLAVGVVIGQIKIKGFGLGTVTSVLLVGVLVGQLDIVVSPTLKSTFFLLFLFAIGYSVGPQFVQGLRKDGLPQILFAAIVCILCLGFAYAGAVICGFDAGQSAGLFAGASTISGAIGVATDTINNLGIDAAEKTKMINEIPVAYAVTYIFGTAGTAWFLATMGPKILRVDIVKASKEYEEAHGGSIGNDDPSLEDAYDGTTFRVFEAAGELFAEPTTVEKVEKALVVKDWPVYIERIRQADGTVISDPEPGQEIKKGDHIVLNGPIETLLKDESIVGCEVADADLLNFRVEAIKVLVSNKKAIGCTLGKLRTMKARHGVVIRDLKRGNANVPLLRNVKLERGDVIELEGRKVDVDRFAEWLGYPERPSNVTDMLYVAAGIFIGGLLGSLTVHAGSIPISLSASGGVLIMGIVFGWLRGKKPTIGYIPEPAIWLMNNLGLNVFIAVVGISAGPNFVSGLKEAGVALFVAGIFVSILPMLAGLLLGKYVFKFHPSINLGANAGARTTTAALGAIEERAQSKVPALAYTTTYAIGNTLLIIWGMVMVLLTY
ncbi:aspartate-alanine antiporter [uncultured Alistipes sp.]|jgi:aspartate-alanine antiporter|uniref:aspartate-alanine antiporter n=1 Tax=uncultured Alistipes sp. TaxID=538949 RepID=UPI0025D76117|nr:aspartate-alanine antiporter [uncultured Alistipes sp.]